MVSVIVPTYNEEKALPATLDGLFRQRGAYEVIVVDGGSSDRTVILLKPNPAYALKLPRKEGRCR